MFGLVLSLVLAIASSASPGGAPLDEADAGVHHQAFILRMLSAHWGEEKTNDRFRDHTKLKLPATQQAAFPVDKVRGVYTNSPGARGKLVWRGVGLEAWPDGDSASKVLGALAELDYHFEYGFNQDTAPVTCAPAPSPTQGYRGAGACYFAIKAEYFEPGFWVALREVDGFVVVAGVLEHKVAHDEPLKDRGLPVFLKAIDARFAPPAPSPGPKNKAP